MSLFVDDPTPTTGGPVKYEFPDGCTCHIRDDIDRGEQYVAPPEGCRVHTPWVFPGYSLAQEGAKADVIGPDGTHVYWSTHCRHGQHEDCAATEHAPGVPRHPAQCKVCAAPCVCPCNHGLSETDSRLAGEGLLLVPQGVRFPDADATADGDPCGPACECRGTP